MALGYYLFSAIIMGRHKTIQRNLQEQLGSPNHIFWEPLLQ